ncbi:MAG: fructokinase [Firmicutes bacterium]|nr:fructokinase [Bacillota bacterium]
MTLYGGIEAGGTKFICAVGTGPNDLRAVARFPTTTPAETIGQAIAFFQQQPEPVAAIGIGSFGPVDPDPSSADYGTITSTPKPGWQNVRLREQIQAALRVPVGFDTDVNAAALGEHRWGAARGLDTFIYLTVGTGIGGGGMVGGRLMHGLIHPEMGHIRVPHDWQADPFAGTCPYHGDCLEGLASGPAVERRWGVPGDQMPPDHPGWQLQAHYMAHGLATFVCTLSPQRIILGGGVMQQEQLLPMLRKAVQTLLNGYVQSPAILEQIDQYIVPPALGGNSGVLGAIALAEREARRTKRPAR